MDFKMWRTHTTAGILLSHKETESCHFNQNNKIENRCIRQKKLGTETKYHALSYPCAKSKSHEKLDSIFKRMPTDFIH